MTIAVDQNLGTGGADSPGTTAVLTTSATAASGSFIVLFVTWFGVFSLSSVSGGGLTWNIDKQDHTDGANGVAIVSAQAPSGLPSSTAITATYSGSVGGARFIAGDSFTGVATSSPLDGTPPAVHADTTAAWTTTAATVLAGSVIVGLSCETSSLLSSTATSPSIELQDFGQGGAGATAAYRLPGSAGSFAVAGAWSGTVNSQSIAVAYQAAAAASAPFGSPNLPFMTPQGVTF